MATLCVSAPRSAADARCDHLRFSTQSCEAACAKKGATVTALEATPGGPASDNHCGEDEPLDSELLQLKARRLVSARLASLEGSSPRKQCTGATNVEAAVARQEAVAVECSQEASALPACSLPQQQPSSSSSQTAAASGQQQRPAGSSGQSQFASGQQQQQQQPASSSSQWKAAGSEQQPRPISQERTACLPIPESSSSATGTDEPAAAAYPGAAAQGLPLLLPAEAALGLAILFEAAILRVHGGTKQEARPVCGQPAAAAGGCRQAGGAGDGSAAATEAAVQQQAQLLSAGMAAAAVAAQAAALAWAGEREAAEAAAALPAAAAAAAAVPAQRDAETQLEPLAWAAWAAWAACTAETAGAGTQAEAEVADGMSTTSSSTPHIQQPSGQGQAASIGTVNGGGVSALAAFLLSRRVLMAWTTLWRQASTLVRARVRRRGLAACRLVLSAAAPILVL